jgi:hypothetical protein
LSSATATTATRRALRLLFIFERLQLGSRTLEPLRRLVDLTQPLCGVELLLGFLNGLF